MAIFASRRLFWRSGWDGNVAHDQGQRNAIAEMGQRLQDAIPCCRGFGLGYDGAQQGKEIPRSQNENQRQSVAVETILTKETKDESMLLASAILLRL